MDGDETIKSCEKCWYRKLEQRRVCFSYLFSNSDLPWKFLMAYLKRMTIKLTFALTVPQYPLLHPLFIYHAILKLNLMELLRPWFKVTEVFIEEHQSTNPKTRIPWAAIVPKIDSFFWNISAARSLNRALFATNYSFQRQEDLRAQLIRCTFFRKLDIRSASLAIWVRSTAAHFDSFLWKWFYHYMQILIWVTPAEVWLLLSLQPKLFKGIKDLSTRVESNYANHWIT